jgi:hypothetical protein
MAGRENQIALRLPRLGYGKEKAEEFAGYDTRIFLSAQRKKQN